jgi:hypothetical protein
MQTVSNTSVYARFKGWCQSFISDRVMQIRGANQG